MPSEIATRFLKLTAYPDGQSNKNAGARRAFRKQQHHPSGQGFSTEDILWAVGIWSVILTLSPVVVFYVLMVA